MDIVGRVKDLLDFFEESQWKFKPDFSKIKGLPIITRDDLRNIPMKKGLYSVKTSGSTGEQLEIQKTSADYLWHSATNIRQLQWLGWDTSKSIAIIKPGLEKKDYEDWSIHPHIIPFENQGKRYEIDYEKISVIQKWLENKNPHYIHAAPSIIAQLDLTKISNYIDHKGTGELGGKMYSSEECGTIALRCPDNPLVYHVMENMLVETDVDDSIIVTCMTNPYVKRYRHGDHVELGECFCGRTLQTITKIHGRVRNMFIFPNGDKKWPTLGTRDYYTKFDIKRYKAIQKTVDDLEIQIIRDKKFTEKELEMFIEFVQEWIGAKINVHVVYVKNFEGGYKFEEFISLVST